jgi:flagellar hook-basal body complex protein FliE
MKKLENLLAANMRRFRTKNLNEASMNADSNQPTNSPIYRLYNSLVKLGFNPDAENLTQEMTRLYRGIKDEAKNSDESKKIEDAFKDVKNTVNKTVDKSKELLDKGKEKATEVVTNIVDGEQGFRAWCKLNNKTPKANAMAPAT